MTTTQRPPIGRADTAPTAAQRVVAAMWTLGKPATPKVIAEAAKVGYSTVTPILRHLLADNQAVKTDNDTGPAEWQLTATLPTPTTTSSPTSAEDETPAQEPIATHPGSAPPATASGAETNQPDDPGAAPALETLSGNADGTDTDTDTDTNSDSDSDGDGEPDTPAADDTAPAGSADAEQQPTARTYRKPVQPRRPKGELRAAVLAVLTGAPETPFKVSEVCKAINAANTDGTSNKAGAGAVANALDKLVTSGDAIRVEDAKYATYQAAVSGG
jgi:hypothetical protein